MSPRIGNDSDPMQEASITGGAGRVRTGDVLLAKQVLYQLSYDPKEVSIVMFKELSLKIYFVRSTETQKTAGLTPPLPSTIGAITHVMLPSP
jgi:hypothetical protein